MNWEVFITCAVTGAGDTAGKSPLVPVSPEQIADAAIGAARAGAAVAHIHVRDPETGRGGRDPRLFREVVERIVPVRGERLPVETRVELPVATGGAEDAEIEVIGGDELEEIVDDGTGEPPDFQLPDEPREPRRSW